MISIRPCILVSFVSNVTQINEDDGAALGARGSQYRLTCASVEVRISCIRISSCCLCFKPLTCRGDENNGSWLVSNLGTGRYENGKSQFLYIHNFILLEKRELLVDGLDERVPLISRDGVVAWHSVGVAAVVASMLFGFPTVAAANARAKTRSCCCCLRRVAITVVAYC